MLKLILQRKNISLKDWLKIFSKYYVSCYYCKGFFLLFVSLAFNHFRNWIRLTKTVILEGMQVFSSPNEIFHSVFAKAIVFQYLAREFISKDWLKMMLIAGILYNALVCCSYSNLFSFFLMGCWYFLILFHYWSRFYFHILT